MVFFKRHPKCRGTIPCNPRDPLFSGVGTGRTCSPANIWKNINGIGIMYRYGINSQSDRATRNHRFRSCRTYYRDLYPQPVRVVREIEITLFSSGYRKPGRQPAVTGTRLTMGLSKYQPAVPAPALHLDTIRILRPVLFTRFFPAGTWRDAFQFVPGFFCITQKRGLFNRISVIHGYPVSRKGIRTGRTAGESDRPVPF